MAVRAKQVCVIGAGPSGLVAAKTLTHDHPQGVFHVTVFEKGDRLGGLWPVSKKDDGLVNPDMYTNQSLHTVSFSDHAWPDGTHSFPRAWEVGKYLQRYTEAYDGYDIRMNCQVEKARLQNGSWKIQVLDKKSSNSEVLSFDHLIVATGFFGKARIPPVLEGFSGPVWHSSRLRRLEAFLNTVSNPSPGSHRNVVVVGGQASGVETAGSVALQLSSAANSPGERPIPNADEYTVTHIVQQPTWIMPLFFPNDPTIAGTPQEEDKINHAPTFLPVDLVTYNLAFRPPGPLQNQSGQISVEAAGATHKFFTKYIGSDQSNLRALELAVTDEARSQPPFLGLSDEYPEFVRSGKIKPIKGKVTKVFDGQANSIVVEEAGHEIMVEDVDAVILATGFDASPSLDFFDEDILQTLQFDPECDEFPLALNVHAAATRALPSLGFVGFYRSPYWGVMEMQARYLGKLWTADESAIKALEEDKTMETMLKLRRHPRRAQFPMGDYAYLMESFASILGIKRFQPENDDARTGLVMPARYSYSTASEKQKGQVEVSLSRFYNEFSKSETERRYLARAVFRSLQGSWKLEREITSFIDSYPSGRLTGTAQFHPRFPTVEGFDLEHLYLEKGEFNTSSGLKFSANRSYVYRYREDTDKLTTWFTKDDHKSVDYFFHEITFLPRTDDYASRGWLAKSGHWCQPDQYDVEYEFKFKGISLEEWSAMYRVKGPEKDYILHSRYTR